MQVFVPETDNNVAMIWNPRANVRPRLRLRLVQAFAKAFADADCFAATFEL
jgi:hypothetical protein